MTPIGHDLNRQEQVSIVVYGATRVFDLFTLMAITLAFAAMFAWLKFLAPILEGSPLEISLGVGGFVTLTALSQMFLFGGRKPRAASLVAGPVLLLFVAQVFIVPEFERYNNGSPNLATLGVLSVLFGVPGGYLAGAVIAGVFLIADALRGRYNASAHIVDRDMSFDDVE